MTLPTVVGVGTVSAGTGDVTPGLPSGWAANDIHLMVVEQSAVNNFGAAPSGWALVTNCQQKFGSAATDGNIQVFWRRAVAGDPDPATMVDTINHTSARIIGIRGCPTTGNPWDVTNGGTEAAGLTVTITGNTTTVPDCLVVIFGGTGVDQDSTTEWSLFVNTDLVNLTERMDNYNSQGNGGGFACATGEKATAGAYGNTTAAIVNSETKAWCTIALKPATGRTTKNTDTVFMGVGAGVSRRVPTPPVGGISLRPLRGFNPFNLNEAVERIVNNRRIFIPPAQKLAIARL